MSKIGLIKRCELCGRIIEIPDKDDKEWICNYCYKILKSENDYRNYKGLGSFNK